MQTVTADDGTRLFVESRGEGKLRLFLCDGIACDGFIWKYLWEDLAPTATSSDTVALTHWHYRGHGRSAPPADPARVTIADHADDLFRVRQALGDPPSVLVGHSMGCQVVLESLRRHKANVKGLVILCGSSGRITSTFHGGPILEMVLPKLIDLASKSPDIVRAVWSRMPVEMALKIALKMGEVDPEKLRPEDLLPYLTHVTHVDVPMFLRMLQAAGAHSAEDMLGQIDVPTLVVAGGRDTFTPPDLAEAMAKAIPGAELFVIERGSHVAPIEQPDVINARIRTFLEERVL